MISPRPSASVTRRDRALRRLLHARLAVSALAVVLTLVFVQAAARAFPGHAAHAADPRRPGRVPATRPARRPGRVVPPARSRHRHAHRLVRPAAAAPTSSAPTATRPTATAPAPTTPAPAAAPTPAPAATAPAPAPAPVVSGGS